MDLFIKIFLAPLVFASLFSYFLTPFVIKLAWKLDLVDDPKKHKHVKVIHTYPVPRGGGLAIFLAILFSVFLFLPIDKHILGILLGATILVIVGLLDDKYDLSPYLRLGLQFVAALFPVLAGIGISFITNPINGKIIDLSNPKIVFDFYGTHSIWILSSLFAIFWIVYMMNAVNFGAKGVDGQLSGVMVISALTIAFLSLKFISDPTQLVVLVLAVILAGAFLGFLPYHIYPQKIMPSFGGSNLGAYLLSVLSIISTTKVGVLAVVLAIPLIDTGYVIIRRVLNGKSPFWGDRGHLHHRLLDAGLSKRQVAYFYWFATSMLGVIALNLNSRNKFYTIVGVAIFVGGLILWLTHRQAKK